MVHSNNTLPIHFSTQMYGATRPENSTQTPSMKKSTEHKQKTNNYT